MSIQAVWIIPRPPEHRSPEVAFSRFYPTFIKQAKQTEGKHYVEIPSNPEFAKCVIFSLADDLEQEHKFNRLRDSCKIPVQKPVYEISCSHGKLWPVIIVEQKDKLLCCLPFVKQGAHNRPPIVDIPGVTLGFTLMCALTDFLRQTPSSEVKNKVTDLYGFLTQAAPFGTLLNTTVDSILAMMYNKPSSVPKTLKQPAWKPVLHKGKNQMFLSVTEYVRAVQYDKDNIDDVWDVYGTISCKAELEGVMPTVTLTISQMSEGELTPVDHILIHPCVQSADAQIVNDGSQASPRRIRFTPPLETITLCHYTVSQPPRCPITGSFEMFVEEKRTKVNVRLKLSEHVKNQFEYCELQIPIPNSSISSIQDSSLNHGNLVLSNDRTTAVWNIGQRFPLKSPEIHMSAVLLLGDGVKSKNGSLEDQFCTGQSSYAKCWYKQYLGPPWTSGSIWSIRGQVLCFKIPDYTMSGCFIDPKSIQVSPPLKYKLISAREFFAMEYKLWNVHGDSLVSAIPKFLFAQQDKEEET